MLTKPIKRLWFVFLLSSMASMTLADTLVEWDISSVTGVNDYSVAATNEADGVSATSLSASGVNLISIHNWGYTGSFAANGWDENAINLSKYYSFGITAAQDSDITISGASLSLTHGDFNGMGVCYWELRSSLDGFTSVIDSYSLDEDALNVQVALTSVFSSELEVLSGGSIEFRLYGYYPDGSSSSGDYSGFSNMVNGNYSGDVISGTGSNLTLYGSIPEPTTVCLSVLTAAFALLLRRLAIA